MKAVVLIDTELPVPISGVSKELKRILNEVKNIEKVKDAYVKLYHTLESHNHVFLSI